MSPANQNFDIAIIGGGPGGYVAALRAAQLKLRTILVEREHLGGICLNWGCIPTKTLLHSADTLRRVRAAESSGILQGTTRADFPRIMQQSRMAAQRLNRGVTHLLKKAGVVVIEGSGSLLPDKTLHIAPPQGESLHIKASHIILATGARARQLPTLPFDGSHVWSYRDALSAKDRPATLLVVGAGAIGLEFASFYAALGTEVTVIEAAPRILPQGDEDVSVFVHEAMRKDGIRILTGAKLAGARVSDGRVQAELQHQNELVTLCAERALVAVGLVGNIENLGLENFRVTIDRDTIAVDEWGMTGEPGIYAIGDVTGTPMLAHKASHEGLACIEHIAGLASGPRPKHNPIPSCVYSHPQSAAVGLTEAQARARHGAVKVGKFPFEANGKAIAIGEPSGFIKTIFDAATGELLGAHLVGPEVTELVHGYTLAAALETTESELMETIFPHPSLSEAMQESVLAAYGRALHI